MLSSTTALASFAAEDDLVLLLGAAPSPLRQAPRVRHNSARPSGAEHLQRPPPQVAQHQQQPTWFSSPVKVRRPAFGPLLRRCTGTTATGGGATTATTSTSRGPLFALPLALTGRRHDSVEGVTSPPLLRPDSASKEQHDDDHHHDDGEDEDEDKENRDPFSLHRRCHYRRRCAAAAAPPDRNVPPAGAGAAVASSVVSVRAATGVEEGHRTEARMNDDDEEEEQAKQEDDEVEGSAWAMPPEVWVLVFQQLPARDVCACRLTCTRWHGLASDGVVWRHLYGRDWGHHHHNNGQTQHSADSCLPAKAGLWREAYLQRWVESAATAAAQLRDAANAATTALALEEGGSAAVERARGPKRYGGHHRRGEGPILLGRRRQPAGPWEDADHRRHQEEEEEERGRPRPAKRSKPQRRHHHHDEEEQQQQEAEWREAMLRAYFAAIDRESLTEADE